MGAGRGRPLKIAREAPAETRMRGLSQAGSPLLYGDFKWLAFFEGVHQQLALPAVRVVPRVIIPSLGGAGFCVF